MSPKPKQYMDKPSKPMDLKNRARATRIVELLADTENNYTFTEIAEQLGIGRRQLYNVMARDNIMELMHRDFLEREALHLDHIDELWGSQSPTDKRKAADLEEKRQNRIQSRIMPTLSESRHITTNTAQIEEINNYKEHLDKLIKALSGYPPALITDFWDKYHALEQNPKWTGQDLYNQNPSLYSELSQVTKKHQKQTQNYKYNPEGQPTQNTP